MSRVYIIVDAEINHNGDLDIAKKMIETAKECGADCIKFQYIIANEIAEPSSEYYDLFSKVELTKDQFSELKTYSEDSVGIEFMMTVTSVNTFYMTKEIGIKKIKVSSSNLTNILLLREIGKFKEEFDIYCSTGMATLSDIELALSALNYNENDRNFHLFHCTTNYPADYESLNLNMITTMKSAFRDIAIGYSDHTTDNLAAIACVAMGVELFEKHFTLDNEMTGPDHFFSLDPKGLKQYILDIRDTIKALGKYEKTPAFSELEMINKARRFLVFKNGVNKDERLTAEMFDTKRLGNAESAVDVRYIDLAIKLKAPRDYKAGDVIRWSDFSL